MHRHACDLVSGAPCPRRGADSILLCQFSFVSNSGRAPCLFEEAMPIWSHVVLAATFGVVGFAARLRKEPSMEDVEQVSLYYESSRSHLGSCLCIMWWDEIDDGRWRPQQKAWVQFMRKQQRTCRPINRWDGVLVRAWLFWNATLHQHR